MTANNATAEVFLTAFKSLPRKQRSVIFEKMLQEKEFLEDILDIVTIEKRANEPSRDFDEYLRFKKRKK